ncbi:MAG: hypothetical protein WB662_01525 [Methyloceanibacter sp.]
MIDLNALLRRRVEYYELPWAIEGRLLSAQSRLRSLFQSRHRPCAPLEPDLLVDRPQQGRGKTQQPVELSRGAAR